MKVIIWTNHALVRLKERKIKKNLIELTITNPQKVTRMQDQTIEFQRKINNQTIIAIGKVNKRDQFLIFSCWANPPNPGTKDFKKRTRYFKMKHASFGKKIWLSFLYTIGL